MHRQEMDRPDHVTESSPGSINGDQRSQPETASRGRSGAPGRAGYVYHRLLAVSDLFAIVLAASIAGYAGDLLGRPPGLDGYIPTLAIMIPVWFMIAYAGGLFHQVDRRITQDWVDEVGPIIVASTAWAWGFIVVRAAIVSGVTTLASPVLMWILMIALLLIFRAALRSFARNREWNRRPVATIGDLAGLAALSERIERHPEWNLETICEIEMAGGAGMFALRPSGDGDGGAGLEDPDLEGRMDTGRMIEMLVEAEVERAIIVGSPGSFSLRSRLVRKLVENGIVVDDVAGGPENFYPSTSLHHLEGMTVMTMRPSRQNPFEAFLKRALDVLLSTGGLILVSPVLLVSALMIRLDSPGPVIFRQARGGRDGDVFHVAKLRTMRADADLMRKDLKAQDDVDGRGMLKIKDDPRVTRVGSWLRRWSIDEIPQLWNVLVGEMSLVGPRPLPLDESALVAGDFKVRESMRPGITGPWQVMGRSEIPMQDMLKLDYTYVVGWTLAEDLRLVMRTAAAVTKRRGVY